MGIATIFDVAKAAGVSIKTVSLVMNGHANVREETRARVLKAAQDLHYRPNYSARSLAGSRSFLLGLLYDNPIASYVTNVQMGAVSYCRKKGYHVMCEPIDASVENVDQHVSQLITTLRPDGLILTPLVSDNVAVLERVEAFGTPYVRIAPGSDRDRSPHVLMSDVQAAAAMTNHLLDLGHRKIAFIKGHPKHGAAHLRYEGFLSAMHAADAPVRAEYVLNGDFSFECGVACGEELLSLPDRPTAIFACNDEMAVGVMMAAHRRGLHVPHEVSLAGFDDAPSASVVWPQLTTIRQPIFEMAAVAAEMLVEGRANRDESGAAPVSVLLDFAMVRRESTAPPP
ncbi:MAG TPA: LacI family DNA-binding transcriptional regulator [Caulobacterales bacterium]|nr:LacI family DNA-binding transcriptional regulator [Caulobacterales bacterium]